MNFTDLFLVAFFVLAWYSAHELVVANLNGSLSHKFRSYIFIEAAVLGAFLVGRFL